MSVHLPAVLAAIQAVVAALKRTLKTGLKPPSESQLMNKYDKLCITIDEVIHEVLLPHLLTRHGTN
jgi:hypothetical protein